MCIERSTRQLGNRVVMKRIVLFLALGQFVVCTTALGNLINMTGAEQQVGGGTGYKSWENISYDTEEWVPPVPLGPVDAHLDSSLTNYGVSGSASLDSLFSEDQVVADGPAFASAVWGTQPTGALDIHGGAASTFALSFTKVSSPAYFYVGGQIDIDMGGDSGRHPEEVFVHVRLFSDDSTTPIWEEVRNGLSGNSSIPFAHGLWLVDGKTYLLEAYSQAGTGISPEYSTASQSNSASFSFTATASEVTVDIVPDTIATNTKSITCYIWPPDGLDVTQIVQDSIRLNDDIRPSQISVRSKQQMLVVKFPTSGLELTPTLELPLSVTGDITGGPSFEGTDSVAVVQKGGKPN